MATNTRISTLTARRRATDLPLDPPPFYLEGEIPWTGPGFGIQTTCVGLLVLLALWLLSPDASYPLPSLTVLLVTSVGSAGYYHAVRFVSCWVVWAWVIRSYPSMGGIHPAARGELPRNMFLLALLSPLCAFVPLLGVCMYAGGEQFLPEIWLVVAVAAAISIRDVRAARRLLCVDSTRWVKDTARGMDILKLIDRV